MKVHRSIRTSLIAASACLMATGCASLFQSMGGGSNGGDDEDDAYSGPVTFINQSSHDICTLQ